MAMTAALVGAVAAPVIGGIAGNLMSQGDKDKQAGILKELYAKYANLQLPDTEKMRLALEDYKSVGTYNPQAEQAEQLASADAMQNIAVDPRLRQAQMNQLEALSKLGETGLSPVEMSQLNALQRKSAAENQSRLAQLLQQQDARGVGSSESALAARMLASQSGANVQAQQADDLAAQAFTRALQAKASAGQLGGQMENTQFGQGAQIAQALNARELANMQQRAQSQTRNIDRFNQAQMSNLANQQQIAASNVGLHNQQQQYNRQLEQQKYENELKRLSGMSGAGTGLAQQYGQQAQATQQMMGNIGSGIGKGFMAMGMQGAKKPTTDDASTDTDRWKKAIDSQGDS